MFQEELNNETHNLNNNYDDFNPDKYLYIVDLDEYGMIDYKSQMFFRTHEHLYVPYMTDDDVLRVSQVFMKEHEKFFSNLIEKFKEPFYSDTEILHDLQVFVYTFIFENKNKLNVFLEYHKSMCFLYVKRHMTNKFYELKHLYYQTPTSNLEEQDDISQTFYKVSERRNFYYLDYEFDDSPKLDDVSFSVSDLTHEVRNILSHMIEESSILYFLIKFFSKTKKLNAYLIECCYGYNEKQAQELYATIKEKFSKYNTSSKERESYDYSMQMVERFAQEFNKELIVIDSKYFFHKKIKFLNDEKSLYAWEKRLLSHFENKTITLSDLISSNHKFNKLLVKFIYFIYKNIYTPVGYISSYCPDTDTLTVSKLPLSDKAFEFSVNKYYRF